MKNKEKREAEDWMKDYICCPHDVLDASDITRKILRAARIHSTLTLIT
jgi:hypothetical protein